MIEVTKDMRNTLKEFNLEHQLVLQETAKTLLNKGIARVHYGIDYVNDDGDAAEYAVLEYTDGRVEELDEWLEDLDYQTFGFGMRYCLPYTFDVTEAKVNFDVQGGTIDTVENVIRMYHSKARLEKLELEKEESNFELDLVSYTNQDELGKMKETFQARGVKQVFFGVDNMDETYTLSNWGILVFDDETEQLLDYCPTELEEIQDVIDELPQCGAFVFDVETCMIQEDFEGGIFEMTDTKARAYHTQEQLEALEAREASNG
jgi:hypothetical protein